MKMQVMVYFVHEPTGDMTPVASFSNEELYMNCLNALEEAAKTAGMTVAETVNYEQEVE